MCQRPRVRLNRGCNKNRRQRQARRIQRIREQSPVDDSRPTLGGFPILPGESIETRAIVEIALRTIALFRRNNVIQQKMKDLRKETKDFIDSEPNIPENESVFSEHIRIYCHLLKQTQQLQAQHIPLLDCIRLHERFAT